MNILNWLISLFKKEPPAPGFTGSLVESPLDLRDIPMSAVLTGTEVVPLSFSINVPLTKKDQGQTPECVAYSGSTINEFLQSVLGTKVVFDPDWLYHQCKKIDGMPDTPGTYFRVMLSILKNVGCLPLGSDASNLALIAQYKIKGYMQVDCTPEALKTAIYKYGTILTAFKGSNGGWQTAIVRPPKIGEKTWNHATTSKAYNPNIFTAQNSWGDKWADNGDFCYNYQYMPFEAWAVINELPSNWESLLPNYTKKPKHEFTVQLFEGMEGDEVKTLQDCLVWLGCMTQAQVDTGYGTYGQRTRNAVKLFQLRYGITQTGNVGPLTLSKLNSIFI